MDALKPALTGASRGRPGSLHVGMDRAAVDAAPEHVAAETEPSCARSQNKRTFTTTWRAFERLDRTNDRCWGQSGRSRGRLAYGHAPVGRPIGLSHIRVGG